MFTPRPRATPLTRRQPLGPAASAQGGAVRPATAIPRARKKLATRTTAKVLGYCSTDAILCCKTASGSDMSPAMAPRPTTARARPRAVTTPRSVRAWTILGADARTSQTKATQAQPSRASSRAERGAAGASAAAVQAAA